MQRKKDGKKSRKAKRLNNYSCKGNHTPQGEQKEIHTKQKGRFKHTLAKFIESC